MDSVSAICEGQVFDKVNTFIKAKATYLENFVRRVACPVAGGIFWYKITAMGSSRMGISWQEVSSWSRVWSLQAQKLFYQLTQEGGALEH